MCVSGEEEDYSREGFFDTRATGKAEKRRGKWDRDFGIGYTVDDG